MSYANAPIVLNGRDRLQSSPANYNNARFAAENQNIIQGDIKEIAVSEVNYPYDIPNMQEGYNTFELVSATIPAADVAGLLQAAKAAGLKSAPGVLTIIVPPGFYAGAELAKAINTDISSEQVSVGQIAGDAPTVAYDQASNRFRFLAPANAPPGNPTPTWSIYSAYTFPVNYDQPTNTLGKDILSIMGFQPYQSTATTMENLVSSDPAEERPVFLAAASAPLAFTQYIDICSPQMCKYQYFRDGSTTNLARRADVICRLFICDNVSLTTTEVEGSRPFIINRQYVNARIMRWTTENSVGTIDIQLYDDCGQPLTTTWQPRPYQITFNAYERSQEGEADRADDEHKGPARYSAYQEKNVSKAWKQLAKQ